MRWHPPRHPTPKTRPDAPLRVPPAFLRSPRSVRPPGLAVRLLVPSRSSPASCPRRCVLGTSSCLVRKGPHPCIPLCSRMRMRGCLRGKRGPRARARLRTRPRARLRLAKARQVLTCTGAPCAFAGCSHSPVVRNEAGVPFMELPCRCPARRRASRPRHCGGGTRCGCEWAVPPPTDADGDPLRTSRPRSPRVISVAGIPPSPR